MEYEITISVGVEADNADEAVTCAALMLSGAFCRVKDLDSRQETEGVLPTMHVVGSFFTGEPSPAWKEWEREMDVLDEHDQQAALARQAAFDAWWNGD